MTTIDWSEMVAQADKRSNGNYPETWKPEHEGDTIYGTLVETGEVETRYGLSETAVIETPEGNRYTVWLGTVLRDAFAKNDAAPGDAVVIRYNGYKTSKSGSTQYRDYTVVVKHPERATPF